MLMRSGKLIDKKDDEKINDCDTKMAESKLSLPSFKDSGAISIENWIKLFERLTSDKPEERTKLVSQYLEDSALNFYIEHDLEKETWTEIKLKLINYFSSEKVFCMQQFLNLTLTECENIEDYYRKKIDLAVKQKVDEQFLIQILINGLPYQLKTLNVSKNFQNVQEWLNYNKPLYYHLRIQEDSQKTKKEDKPGLSPRGIPMQRWRLQNFTPPRFRPAAPFGYDYYRHSHTPIRFDQQYYPRGPPPSFARMNRPPNSRFLVPMGNTVQRGSDRLQSYRQSNDQADM